MREMMQRLGYLTREFDCSEESLFKEAWSLLALDDAKEITLGNLVTFLIAIDKMIVN